MSLPNLADELLLLIVENLDRLSSLNAFARTNHRLRLLLNDELYAKDARDGHGTAIHWAAREGIEQTATLSLTQGTHVDIDKVLTSSSKRCDRYTADDAPRLSPLQVAIAYGHEHVACILILHGADVSRVYPEPFSKPTPLHIASASGLVTVVKLLLQDGANLNARDKFGQTSLHYAVKHNEVVQKSEQSVQIVALLLKEGAQHTIRDKFGRTPELLLQQRQRKYGFRVHMDAEERSSAMELDYNWAFERHFTKRTRHQRLGEGTLQAERKIRKLLEAKDALILVAKWEQDRELQKRRNTCQEEAYKVHAAKSRERRTQRRNEKAILENNRIEATKLIEEAMSRDKVEADRIKRELDQARLEERQRVEMQAAVVANWSRLREEATRLQLEQDISAVHIDVGCLHSSLGRIKSKRKVQCERCNTFCRKYSYSCPDCDSTICQACHNVTRFSIDSKTLSLTTPKYIENKR